MAVGFLTKDFSEGASSLIPGGCAYYRCFLPMQASGQDSRMGLPAWTAETGFGVMAAKDRAQFGFDTVVLKQIMEHNVVHQIVQAQKLGQRVIVDVDDFYDGLPETNQAFIATSPERSKTTNRNHYREIIKAADLVIVSTPFLFNYYSKIARDTVMVRNGVLPKQFDIRKVRDRKPVIGWVGGVPWRGKDLETMQEWLPDFLEDNDLMFHHSGHTDLAASFAELTGVSPTRVTTSPLQPLDKYHELFTFDIGIVPLNDIPFNHAKSTLKGLEYASAGIPFVAQGLPEYERLSGMGVGRIAHTADDWVKQLTALLDFSTRKKDSRTNFERVVREHTIMAREPEWKQVLKTPNR